MFTESLRLKIRQVKETIIRPVSLIKKIYSPEVFLQNSLEALRNTSSEVCRNNSPTRQWPVTKPSRDKIKVTVKDSSEKNGRKESGGKEETEEPEDTEDLKCQRCPLLRGCSATATIACTS